MTPKIRTTKEADAIKKLDESALIAQERIQRAADKAQKMIDDATEAATKALNDTARIPDKRNIDGSFQWDRGDRYRRGSDDRLARVEDKVNGINRAEGLLEVGQARREEQIVGLLANVKTLTKEFDQLRTDLDTTDKETTSRLSTMRELILEVRDAGNDKVDAAKNEMHKAIDEGYGGSNARIDALRDDAQKDKIRNQQYVIGIVVGFIVTVVLTIVTTYIHIR